jgi:hypothetical protein
MTTHTSVPGEFHRTASHLFELGWPSFWLLTGILGGILGLVALLFLLLKGF